VLDFMVPNNPGEQGGRRVMQSMASEAGSTEDPRHRIRDVTDEAEKGNYQLYFLAWSGRTDPDGNIFSFATCGGPLTTASTAIRRSMRC